MIRSICLIAYYMVGSRLPPSYVPGGKFFNAIRVALLRGIIPVGRACLIEPRVYIGRGRNISVGAHCEINQGVRLIDVQLGDYVMVAPFVNIIGGQVHNHARTDIPMALQGESDAGPVIVEEDVWIGVNAVLLAGTRIGKGSIVAAGSVVTRDVEPYSVVGGVPATVLRNRKEKTS